MEGRATWLGMCVAVVVEMAKKKWSHSSIPLSKLSGKDQFKTWVTLISPPTDTTLLAKITDMLNSFGGNKRD